MQISTVDNMTCCSQGLCKEISRLDSSELMKLQLAWLEQGLDEFESHIRLQSYLEVGLDPDLAAAAVSADIHMDDLAELRERVEDLEQVVALLMQKLEQITSQ
jgi:hypothetical protein